MGRVLAFDYGNKRIGLAVTDPMRIIASPLDTIHPKDIFEYLEKYMAREQVDAFVIGKPMYMDGTDMQISQQITAFVNRLKKLFPNTPIHHIDERFTSGIAKQTLLDAGLKKKDRQDKKKLDTVSATLILQTFLESQ